MSPCCLSCRACEKSITEAPICHHVVLVVVPVRIVKRRPLYVTMLC